MPVGIGVYATTARLEKGYRAHGCELDLEHDLVEAGMAHRRVKETDFVGRDAYLEQRAQPPAAQLLAVECFGDRYPVTVAVVGNRPLFDPANDRVRA